MRSGTPIYGYHTGKRVGWRYHPKPKPFTEIDAFKLGFRERLDGDGAWGRTWDDDQDLNEAYDRGMNLAEELFKL